MRVVVGVLSVLVATCSLRAAPENCDASLKQIAKDLQSSRKEDQFQGLSSLLRCKDYEDLPLVAKALDSRDRLVAAAAAMTLAMSGQGQYRQTLVDRYMGCPGGPGCTTDPVYLRAAVIVACSQLDLGTDPRFYELPRPPIEQMDDLCVNRVAVHVYEEDPLTGEEAPAETPSEGVSGEGSDEVGNFFELASASGSSKWVPLLAPLLTVEEPEVRRRAALAMTRLDPKWAAKYFPPLLDDENPFVRTIVVYALAEKLTPGIRAAFQRRLEVETDHSVSVLIRIALGELGK